MCATVRSDRFQDVCFDVGIIHVNTVRYEQQRSVRETWEMSLLSLLIQPWLTGAEGKKSFMNLMAEIFI